MKIGKLPWMLFSDFRVKRFLSPGRKNNPYILCVWVTLGQLFLILSELSALIARGRMVYLGFE
jgi:hypothetical protein